MGGARRAPNIRPRVDPARPVDRHSVPHHTLNRRCFVQRFLEYFFIRPERATLLHRGGLPLPLFLRKVFNLLDLALDQRGKVLFFATFTCKVMKTKGNAPELRRGISVSFRSLLIVASGG
jgi:hypothetical protein